jgi:hypothetical protein
MIMLINEQLISKNLYVLTQVNTSLNETCYKMIENLNTSVKKYSEKKLAFLANDFENKIFDLKK